MKFGVTIKRALNEEWSNYYVDYSGLKKFIKNRQSRKAWDDTDEQAFVNELDKELQKVADFQERKVLNLETFSTPTAHYNPHSMVGQILMYVSLVTPRHTDRRSPRINHVL